MMNADSLLNLMTGLGAAGVDKAASSYYGDLLLDDQQLLNCYRSTWLGRKIVDIPAKDAFRKWRDWQADQKDITEIEKVERRLGVKQKLLQAMTLARLWGGSAIYLGVEGDPRTPLDPQTIKKDGLKYITVLGRREISVDQLIRDPVDERYGAPARYSIVSGESKSELLDIHPSRMLRFVGAAHPDPWLIAGPNFGWGDSVLQSAYTAITHADSTSANVATLVFEACVDVFSIPGLMEHMAEKRYRDKLIERFTLAQLGKSTTRALMIDSEETYERRQIAFTGLPDVIQEFMMQVSGAADIPLTRLLGQSPAGLSATGEHDMKNYHDRIEALQTLEVQPIISPLDDLIIATALGKRPEEIYYTWAPLEQMSEKELAEIGKANGETAATLVSTGIFSSEELRQVVGNQLVEAGFYPGLDELLQQNGETLPEFDLERRAQEASVIALEEGPQPVEGPGAV